jgi:hypothetical protein
VVTNLSVYLVAYVFVPSVFKENIPTAEFGMISAETACLLGHRKKIAKFLMRTFTCRSTFLYASISLNTQKVPLSFALRL